MNAQFLVPRLEDLPYSSSPPIEFVYRQSAPLVAGSYTWASAPAFLATLRPLIANSLYYFRSLTITAEIAEGDYLTAISIIPTFQMYLKSTGKQILFREPVAIAKYFQNFDYRLCWLTQREDDELYGAIAGKLTQTAALIGKQTIYITVVLSAQEIVDASFIKRFREQSYPQMQGEGSSV